MNLPSGALATGLESHRLFYLQTVQYVAGDVSQWYFIRTTIDEANIVDTRNTYNKYIISGELFQVLEVRNISASDKGTTFVKHFKLECFYLEYFYLELVCMYNIMVSEKYRIRHS